MVIDEGIDQWKFRITTSSRVNTMNFCFNVLLLHCWFIDCILTLYYASLKMSDAIITTSESSVILVMYMFMYAAFHKHCKDSL